MKLTKEQITTIQTSLSVESIFYADIKAELVDHIAAQIESELGSEQSFELLLHERLRYFNQKKFQRQILLKTHLGMIQSFFKHMNSFWLTVFVIAVTFVIGFWINAIYVGEPFLAEKALKTSFIILLVAIIVIGFSKPKMLKNSQIVAAGNTLFMIGMISQFVLRLEWLQWTGLSNQALIYEMTFWFCLILVAGFRMISSTIKKTALA